jgi:hypothetical protein
VDLFQDGSAVREVGRGRDVLGLSKTVSEDARSLVGEVSLGGARTTDQAQKREDNVQRERVGRLFSREHVEEIQNPGLEVQGFDLEIYSVSARAPLGIGHLTSRHREPKTPTHASGRHVAFGPPAA